MMKIFKGYLSTSMLLASVIVAPSLASEEGCNEEGKRETSPLGEITSSAATKKSKPDSDDVAEVGSALLSLAEASSLLPAAPETNNLSVQQVSSLIIREVLGEEGSKYDLDYLRSNPAACKSYFDTLWSYVKTTTQPDPNALFAFALCLYSSIGGRSTIETRNKAFQIFIYLHNEGMVNATYCVGAVFLNNEKLVNKGIKMLRVLSAIGHVNARYALGRHLIKEPSTSAEGIDLLRLAVNANHIEATYLLGKCLAQNTDTAKEGVLLLKKASERDHIGATKELITCSQLHNSGLDPLERGTLGPYFSQMVKKLKHLTLLAKERRLQSAKHL